jgi:hypothetical protein
MIMKSTQALMECLLEQVVDTVFGYPGGTILNIYDEFERNGYGKKIRHILTTHEQGASHAADGYARATGRVGVCFATSGPGATHLTTGIATAYMDSSPCIYHGQRRQRSTQGLLSGVDITGNTMPITKGNYLCGMPRSSSTSCARPSPSSAADAPSGPHRLYEKRHQRRLGLNTPGPCSEHAPQAAGSRCAPARATTGRRRSQTTATSRSCRIIEGTETPSGPRVGAASSAPAGQAGVPDLASNSWRAVTSPSWAAAPSR